MPGLGLLQIGDKPPTCNVVGTTPWSRLVWMDSPGRCSGA